MNAPKTSAKDFFLWFGAMLSLYWSVIAFISLLFNYIDYAFPNVLAYMPDPYRGGMPYEMASLLVLVPIYIALARIIRRTIAVDPSKKDIWARRWAIILTLFVAAVSIAIDVITLLTSFFSGADITLAFAFKIIVVFLVTATIFMHFIADLKGYWDAYPKRELSVCAAMGVLVLVTIAAGFFIVGTPQHARQLRMDTERVSDLQSLQSEIINYWQSKAHLPADLSMLSDSISGYRVPTDPETNTPYEYKTTGKLSFELCGTFNNPGPAVSDGYTRPMMPKGMGNSWMHDAGHYCFPRTIDPELYPPFGQTR